MSSADLFVDGFPHGTPNGYQKGCRSNGVCPAKLESGQSCKEANIRVSRDSVYRALVQSGAAVEVLRQPEVDAAPAKAAAPRPAPHQAVPKMLQEKPAPALPDDTKLGRELTADLPDLDHRPVSEQMPAAPTKRPTGRPRTAPEHGSNAGYQRGCRTDCPGGPDGRTCVEARADARREERRRRLARTTPAENTALAEDTTSPEAGTPAPDVDLRAAVIVPPTLSGDLSIDGPDRIDINHVQWNPAADQDRMTAAITALDTDAHTLATVTATPEPHQPTEPAAPLLADVAQAFDTLDKEARRSPQVVTPFDGMDGLMASLLRTAWMDGFARGVAS
jgi:hypothetical protein